MEYVILYKYVILKKPTLMFVNILNEKNRNNFYCMQNAQRKKKSL